MEDIMDRRAIAVAVAKVSAYQNVNKPKMAEEWFRVLADLLGFSSLLIPIIPDPTPIPTPSIAKKNGK